MNCFANHRHVLILSDLQRAHRELLKQYRLNRLPQSVWLFLRSSDVFAYQTNALLIALRVSLWVFFVMIFPEVGPELSDSNTECPSR